MNARQETKRSNPESKDAKDEYKPETLFKIASQPKDLKNFLEGGLRACGSLTSVKIDNNCLVISNLDNNGNEYFFKLKRDEKNITGLSLIEKQRLIGTNTSFIIPANEINATLENLIKEKCPDDKKIAEAKFFLIELYSQLYGSYSKIEQSDFAKNIFKYFKDCLSLNLDNLKDFEQGLLALENSSKYKKYFKTEKRDYRLFIAVRSAIASALFIVGEKSLSLETKPNPSLRP